MHRENSKAKNVIEDKTTRQISWALRARIYHFNLNTIGGISVRIIRSVKTECSKK